YSAGDSDCEPLTVDKAQLGIATTVHDPDHNDITNGSVPLGTKAHDSAQLSGGVSGFSLPGVSFSFYTDSGCASGSAIATNGSNEGNGDRRSVDTSALAAGSYGFTATVAGNSNYKGASGDCEPFSVYTYPPLFPTTVHDPDHNDITNGSVPLGTKAH